MVQNANISGVDAKSAVKIVREDKTTLTRHVPYLVNHVASSDKSLTFLLTITMSYLSYHEYYIYHITTSPPTQIKRKK